jgi:hypothetical protein
MWNDTDLPLGYLITFRCYGGDWSKPHSPWADKGSQRYLWNERSLALAIDYVLNGQGVICRS